MDESLLPVILKSKQNFVSDHKTPASVAEGTFLTVSFLLDGSVAALWKPETYQIMIVYQFTCILMIINDITVYPYRPGSLFSLECVCPCRSGRFKNSKRVE